MYFKISKFILNHLQVVQNYLKSPIKYKHVKCNESQYKSKCAFYILVCTSGHWQ
jgi:hypothetical protein